MYIKKNNIHRILIDQLLGRGYIPCHAFLIGDSHAEQFGYLSIYKLLRGFYNETFIHFNNKRRNKDRD